MVYYYSPSYLSKMIEIIGQYKLLDINADSSFTYDSQQLGKNSNVQW